MTGKCRLNVAREITFAVEQFFSFTALNFERMIKQPGLGKKIAELRKAKGLTQNDLASQCMVSVRTLQRIESGVVILRSFSIKNNSTALNYNFAVSLLCATQSFGIY